MYTGLIQQILPVVIWKRIDHLLISSGIFQDKRKYSACDLNVDTAFLLCGAELHKVHYKSRLVDRHMTRLFTQMKKKLHIDVPFNSIISVNLYFENRRLLHHGKINYPSCCGDVRPF